ncbi:murein hydrolase activator EnvC family protein [Actinophytocola algeriensis]|uniref:Murein DD-endopeptidase MepM/ murein hydrolase activator NlpD n=1 Tax=Actinophytocola algeriensis TaxID=1768010 RepID=A0A7W7QBS6_9PSEU|nr:M23 family metallopeptidase [Actinophytocola algeriensis]MBB4910523.1 murein DD-endopeptidase MepM/ murein hydrolase activator NlpD [Actinophytocola algeriensis]MBE1480488.1 murein DD-endopeptidase MepM/ murein hydrolase activator NlpD [Actinophytocola algeriensis]
MPAFLLLLTLLTSTLVVPAAASAPARAPSADPRPRFGWPLAAPHPVVRPYQAPTTPYGPGHRGVDLGGPAGAPVTAAGDGVVVYAADLALRGVVSIDHGDGLRTTYEPVTPAVTVGRHVTLGTVIGHLAPGHLGCTAACLHWGARRGEEYLDPLGLLTTGRVRLLPWDGSAVSPTFAGSFGDPAGAG